MSTDSSSLGGDVAHVGEVHLSASLVALTARAKGSTAPLALDDLVEDALAAQGARAAGLDRSPEVAWATVAALARRIPQILLDEARALGPPTIDELAMVSVARVVVLRSPALSGPRGLATATAIRQAVEGASNTDEFEARAKAVALGPAARLVVERLPAFGADGRTAAGAVVDDPALVSAAFALHSQSERSPILETRVGWHVLQLIDRAAPDAASLEDRSRELSEPVVRMRAYARLAALLRSLKERVPVEIVGASAP